MLQKGLSFLKQLNAAARSDSDAEVAMGDGGWDSDDLEGNMTFPALCGQQPARPEPQQPVKKKTKKKKKQQATGGGKPAGKKKARKRKREFALIDMEAAASGSDGSEQEQQREDDYEEEAVAPSQGEQVGMVAEAGMPETESQGNKKSVKEDAEIATQPVVKGKRQRQQAWW